MALATLLNPDDPLFNFEHAMQHRAPMAIMPNLSDFSIMPYWITPPVHQSEPAGPWHNNHQQAHNDVNSVLPPFYNYNPTMDTGIPFRIMQTQILVEGNRSDRENWTWWTFINHQEHYLLNNAILPIPSGAPSAPAWASLRPLRYPFW